MFDLGKALQFLPLIERLLLLLADVIATNKEVAETTRENTQQIAALKAATEKNNAA